MHNALDNSQLMPFLDSLPIGWLKLPECAPLIQILHMCMVIDVKQNTVETFQEIQIIATTQYKKHYDENFKSLPLIWDMMPQPNPADIAQALNNRAAVLPIQFYKHSFSGSNSVEVNQQYIS